MALDRKLLDVLCCPISKISVRPLKREELRRINAAIAAGELRYLDNSAVEAELDEGLITDNAERAYRVDDGIPIMLEERAIPLRSLPLK
ncbi:MAG: Trm112 family protein [Nitrococcus sp.]|nr:Trm112 family protein [Nitrococcus sp.]